MPQYIVTYTSMVIDADNEDEAIERADHGGGGHWEAVPEVPRTTDGQHSSPEQIIEAVGDEQGWNTDSKLAVALAYITNQGDDSAFEDHVRRVQAEENEV